MSSNESILPHSAAALSARNQKLVRKIALIIGLMTLCRFLLAGSADFMEDEAYYWLWSQHLAAGYYDHPPMVAYWMRAGTALFGQTAFAARFFFVGGIAGASYLLYRASLILFRDAKLAAFVALWFNATLFANTFAIVATPDTPLTVMACALMFALAKVLDTQKNVWWLAVGAALGLAFVSKYTAALLLPGLFLWMIATPFGRRSFLSPYLYLGSLVALLIIAPLVHWNSTHDWMSFAKQMDHSVKDKPANGLMSMLEYVGGQAGIVTPLIFGFCLLGLGFCVSRGWRQKDGTLLMLGLIPAPALLFFLVHALEQKIQANWPGFLFGAALLAAVHGSLLYINEKTAVKHLGALFRAAPALGLILTLLTFAQLGLSAFPVPAKLDPTLRMKGWAELGQAIETIRHEQGADMILTDRYAMTGELAFYTDRPEAVVQVNQRMRYVDFPTPDESRLKSAPAVLIVRTGQDISKISQFFAQNRFLTKLHRNFDANSKDTYDVYLLSHYRGSLFAQPQN